MWQDFNALEELSVSPENYNIEKPANILFKSDVKMIKVVNLSVVHVFFFLFLIVIM